MEMASANHGNWAASFRCASAPFPTLCNPICINFATSIPLRSVARNLGGLARVVSAQMHDNIGPILTISEVSEILRVHRSTIYRLVKRGAFPGFKIGDSWRVSSEALDAWLAEKTPSDLRLLVN